MTSTTIAKPKLADVNDEPVRVRPTAFSDLLIIGIVTYQIAFNYLPETLRLGFASILTMLWAAWSFGQILGNRKIQTRPIYFVVLLITLTALQLLAGSFGGNIIALYRYVVWIFCTGVIFSCVHVEKSKTLLTITI